MQAGKYKLPHEFHIKTSSWFNFYLSLKIKHINLIPLSYEKILTNNLILLLTTSQTELISNRIPIKTIMWDDYFDFMPN